MRPRNLILLTILVLATAAVVLAAEQPAAQPDKPQLALPASGPEFDSRQDHDFAADFAPAQRKFALSARPFRAPTGAELEQLRRTNPQAYQRLMQRLQGMSGNTCYTMRSYYYQRVDGGDAMQRVGETTCSPSQKYQVHEAAPR